MTTQLFNEIAALAACQQLLKRVEAALTSPRPQRTAIERAEAWREIQNAAAVTVNAIEGAPVKRNKRRAQTVIVDTNTVAAKSA